MKYLSLFTGIGGFELAINRVFPNAECVGYSEIDKYAIQTYIKNFPEHRELNFGDIERLVFDLDKKGNFVVNEARVRLLPDFDLLVGGSPCQDLSIAKAKRAGLDGIKSRLFFAYLEILRIKKPKYFILENVASMSKASKEKITEAISSAYGKKVEPMLLNSSKLSAQKRKRLFWFPWEIEEPKDMGIVLKDIVAWSRSTRYPENGEPYVEQRETLDGKANTLTTGQGCGSFSSMNYIQLKKDEPNQINACKKAGNKQPHIQDRVYHVEGKSPALTKEFASRTNIALRPCEMKEQKIHKGECHDVATATDINGYEERKRIYAETGKSPALTTMTGGSREPKILVEKGIYRKLTPLECERLQTFPDNWTDGVSNSQRYKQLGNAVTVSVIEHILKGLK